MGAPSYHPRALLGAWLYGFMRGVRSSRKLEAACREQIPFLWLSGRQCPDHNTLWRFYKGNRQEMRRLLKRTVKTAVSLELVELALQAVDGTKVWANASGDRTLDAEGLRRIAGAGGEGHRGSGGSERGWRGRRTGTDAAGVVGEDGVERAGA